MDHVPTALVCPRCGSRANFRILDADRSSAGLLIFLTGGFLPYLVYRSCRQPSIGCGQCGYKVQPIVVPSAEGRHDGLTLALLFGLPALLLIWVLWNDYISGASAR